MRGFECGGECVDASAYDFERGVELAGAVRHSGGGGGGGAESREMRGSGEAKMGEVAERDGEAEGGPGHWSAAEECVAAFQLGVRQFPNF